MRWQHPIVGVLLMLAVWAALAAWQYDEYGRECQLARETVQRQADSIQSALVGGIRSHRRLGRFFQDQLQGSLDELVASKDILAVALTADDGQTVLSAGQTKLLPNPSAMAAGAFWDPEGFRSVRDFQLNPDAGPGSHSPGGGGGRGMRWKAPVAEESPFSKGGHFYAVLLLDRTAADVQCQRAFWLRLWTVIAGGLVVGLVGLAWLATVRLVETRGRARVLEAEARHLQDLSQAAAGLAHETRNPLGLIRGWTQRLAQSGLAADQQQQAQAVVEECDRVTARINQFLAFAKPSVPKPEAVDVGQLVEELTVLLQPDLETKALALEPSLPKPAPVIQADREMLRQALFNLVWNAVHFAPEKGKVEIGVQSGQDGTVRIEVADRGPGVSPDKTASLFTPYFTTRPDGTGLGLAIVRRIATAHGWTSGYTPRPGGGSIFWLDRMHG
ncbi:MAG: ATP-binding protein [Thermoguttaceae bacterium]|jgi:signal transduction histidine kinase